MTPMMSVGTMTKAKDPFLKTSVPKLPKAGAVEYCPR